MSVTNGFVPLGGPELTMEIFGSGPISTSEAQKLRHPWPYNRRMDDLETFEGWLKHHGYDAQKHPSHVAQWQTDFQVGQARRKAARSATYFNQPCPKGEFRCAIAMEDGESLRSVLVVTRRAKRGEFFVMHPRDGGWDPHASYHQSGQYHFKAYDHIATKSQRQPLNHAFKGVEHLDAFCGWFDSASPIYNPANFNYVLKVSSSVLKTPGGRALVDLFEPHTDHSHRYGASILHEEVFRDFPTGPWLVVAVAE